jgi:hypothetical protein
MLPIRKVVLYKQVADDEEELRARLGRLKFETAV